MCIIPAIQIYYAQKPNAYKSNDQQEQSCKRNVPHIHKDYMETDSNSKHKSSTFT